MLNLAVRNTKKLVREKVKEENVRIGRFFTKKSTARILADMLEPRKKEEVSVLDAGAGTGILAAAMVERLCKAGASERITLVCYENDAVMLPMLKNNLERIRKKCRHDYHVHLTVIVRESNFILDAARLLSPTLFSEIEEKFDYVITNPTSVLYENGAPEIEATREIAVGATDGAHLFAALGAASLAEGGQMAALLPISYARGVYIEGLRRFIHREARLTRMHLFSGNHKNDARADDMRSHMLLAWERKPLTEDATLLVTSSEREEEDAPITALEPIPYHRIVHPENASLLLVRSAEEWDVLERVESLPETLSSLGLKMRTGLTLESRYPDSLRDAPVDGAIPLVHPRNIFSGLIRVPTEKYIIPVIPSLAQKNKNMLFIKRVPAKSDRRHLLCGVYLAALFPRFPMISTHNKLNYIDYEDGREMDSALLHGLYAVLSSDLYEKYCTIMSKSSQINAREYANLPLPDEKTLRDIGSKVLMTRQLSPHACSVLVQNALKPRRSPFI